MTSNNQPPDPASDETPKINAGSSTSEGQSTTASAAASDQAAPASEPVDKPPFWTPSNPKPDTNPARAANGESSKPAHRPDTATKPPSKSERPFTAAKRPAELSKSAKGQRPSLVQRLQQFVQTILMPPQEKPSREDEASTITRRPVPPFISPDAVTDLSGTQAPRRPYIPSSAAVTDLSGTPPMRPDSPAAHGIAEAEKPAAIPARPFHLDTTETLAVFTEAAETSRYGGSVPDYATIEAPGNGDTAAPDATPPEADNAELPAVPPFILLPRRPQTEPVVDKRLREVSASAVETGRTVFTKARGIARRLVDWFNEPAPRAPMPALKAGRIRFLQLVWWIKLVDTTDATQPAPNLLFRALSSSIFIPMVLVNLVVATGLWAISLGRMHPENLTNYGLVSITPITFYISLGLVVAGFAYLLVFHPTQTKLLLLYTFLVAVILYATTAIIYASPRFVWTFKHIGVADYISVYDTVNVDIDVYHSWPGFFALTSLIADATGSMDNLKYIVGWSHFAFNVAYIGGLLLIYRTLSRDPRIIWGGIWFFLITNWVGQDYFAPQAFGFMLALMVYAFILTGMRARHNGALANFWQRFIPRRLRWVFRWLLHPRRLYPSMEEFSSRYWVIFGILVLVLASIVGSHQLTPFMILLALATMLVTRLSNAYLVVVVLLAMTLFWYNVPAAEYMRTSDELATIGDVSSNVSSSVRDTSKVSPELRISMFSSRGLTALAMGLAGLGFLRRFRNGYRDYVLIGLMLSPFPMFFIQSYGGEMLFRTVLFAAPWFCFLLAGLFFPNARWGRSILTMLALIVVSVGILGMYMFAQYGREKNYYFTTAEIEAATYLWEHAPPGSYILSGTFNFPDKYGYRYEDFDLTSLDGQDWFTARDPVRFDTLEIRDLMLYNNPNNSFYVHSKGQIRHSDLMNIYPVGTLEAFNEKVSQSPDFELYYQNEDVTIYKIKVRQDEDVNVERALADVAEERFTQRLQMLEQRFRRERLHAEYMESLQPDDEE
jgi:hypothetical protein